MHLGFPGNRPQQIECGFTWDANQGEERGCQGEEAATSMLLGQITGGLLKWPTGFFQHPCKTHSWELSCQCGESWDIHTLLLQTILGGRGVLIPRQLCLSCVVTTWGPDECSLTKMCVEVKLTLLKWQENWRSQVEHWQLPSLVWDSNLEKPKA